MKSFHRSVRGLGYMKLQETEQLVLAVCPVTKDTGSLVPRAKRDGKLAQFEADTRALREIVYGKGSGQGRQGKWEAEADEWMADHPNYLEGFVEMRAVCAAYSPVVCWSRRPKCVRALPRLQVSERALGFQQYIKTPISYCCPFENDKCKGEKPYYFKLNRINGISNMCKHMVTAHGDNPAAKIAAARLKAADESRRLTSQELDVKCGKVELSDEYMTAQGGNDSGYEQVRKFRSDDDYFEVDFELGTEAHAAWVRTNATA